MNDVKVKAYGLVSLRKKTYITIQIIGAILLVAGLIISLVFNTNQSSSAYMNYLYANGYMRYLFWICIGTLVLEFFETYFMLRKYKKLESETTNA